MLLPEISTKLDRLLDLLRNAPPAAVAYSGGVDSAVVAAAAVRAQPGRCVAILAESPSLASGERDHAEQLAERLGIRFVTLATNEFANPLYVRNAADRCFHCKDELYGRIAGLGDKLGFAVIFNGTVVDDLSDHRPGHQAAAAWNVRSPLVECELSKAEVRQIAALWELPVWDKPATPCLSSRLAYGLAVTPERLRRVDAAEQLLRRLGLRELRVRHHADDLARIEVPAECLAQLIDADTRRALVTGLRELGFRFVTLDLEGFRSGSLNPQALLPVLD